MTTDLDRLKTWMTKCGYDSTSLSKALGYARDTAKNIIDGRTPLNQSFKIRFRKFGDDVIRDLFGMEMIHPGWHEANLYPRQYAAHQTAAKALNRGEIPPAKNFKCHCCDKPAKRHHHQSYHPDDHLCVVPLCDSCHSKAHWGSLDATFGVVPTSVGLIRIAIATAPELQP